MQPNFDFVPPATREEALARAGRDLPKDRQALLKAARKLIVDLDRAIVAGEVVNDAGWRYGAIADALGLEPEQLDAALAMSPLRVPLWGQAGDFIVTAHGCRSWVHQWGLSTETVGRFKLRAVDWDRPWINSWGEAEISVRVGRHQKPFGKLLTAVKAAINAECSIGRTKLTLRELQEKAPDAEEISSLFEECQDCEPTSTWRLKESTSIHVKEIDGGDSACETCGGTGKVRIEDEFTEPEDLEMRASWGADGWLRKWLKEHPPGAK